MILDEATAAIDRQSEEFVLQLLQTLKNEMGIIFITHRLHILKSFCDRIYILEKGSILNHSDYDQLLQTKNLYSNYLNENSVLKFIQYHNHRYSGCGLVTIKIQQYQAEGSVTTNLKPLPWIFTISKLVSPFKYLRNLAI